MSVTAKPIGVFTTATGTGNESNFGKATHVAITNVSTSASYTITRRTSGGVTLGTIIIPPVVTMIVVKDMTDMFSAEHNDCKCTAIAASGT